MNEETMIGNDLPIVGQVAGWNRHDLFRHFAIDNTITNFKLVSDDTDGKELTIELSRYPHTKEDQGQAKHELSVILRGVQDGCFDTVESMRYLPKSSPSSGHMGILGGLPNLTTFYLHDFDFCISAGAMTAFFGRASMLQRFVCDAPVYGTVEDFNLWADTISSSDGSSLREVHFNDAWGIYYFENENKHQRSVLWDPVIQALARRLLRDPSPPDGGNGMTALTVRSEEEDGMVLSNETSHLISRLEANGCVVKTRFELFFDKMEDLVLHCRQNAGRVIEQYWNMGITVRGVHFHFTSEVPDSFISKLLTKNRFGSAEVNVSVASEFLFAYIGPEIDHNINVSPALIENSSEIISRLQDEYPHDRGLVTPLFSQEENIYLCVALNKWNLFDFDPANETTENETWLRMLSVLANIPSTTRLVPGGDPFMQECSSSPLFDLLVQNAYIIGKLAEAGVQT